MLGRRSFLAGPVGAIASGRVWAQSVAPHFEGELILRLLAEDRLMELQKPYTYFDSSGQGWAVPTKAIVDGASIPRLFWTVIGGPWDGKYRNASVVHDWFCAVRVMPWTATHRMFYEAMLTSGTDPQLAKLMFLAVRYCGPSWDDLTLQNSRILTRNGLVRLDPPGIQQNTHGFTSPAEAEQVKGELLGTFNDLARQVRRDDLSPSEIERLVDQTGRQEDAAAMLSQ